MCLIIYVVCSIGICRKKVCSKGMPQYALRPNYSDKKNSQCGNFRLTIHQNRLTILQNQLSAAASAIYYAQSHPAEDLYCDGLTPLILVNTRINDCEEL